jgi:hypothetical protein
MIIAILQGTPVWVWVLLAALVALGLWQGRDRSVAPSRLLLLPLALLVLGLWTVLPSWRAQPTGAGVWLATWLAGAAAGRWLPLRAGATWDAATQRLRLPGSRLPLVVILAVFSLRYGAGVTAAIHPALAGSAGFVWTLAGVSGCISGLLLGHTLRLLSLVPRHKGPHAGATIGLHGSL